MKLSAFGSTNTNHYTLSKSVTFHNSHTYDATLNSALLRLSNYQERNYQLICGPQSAWSFWTDVSFTITKYTNANAQSYCINIKHVIITQLISKIDKLYTQWYAIEADRYLSLFPSNYKPKITDISAVRVLVSSDCTF